MKRIFIILFLIIAILSGCFPPKKTSEIGKKSIFNDPRFYYNEENFTLIRVNPETREEEIKSHLEKSVEKSRFKTEKDSILHFTQPKPIRFFKPHYPNEAKENGCEGVVITLLLIDEKGDVRKAKAIGFFSEEKLQEIINKDKSLTEYLKSTTKKTLNFNYFETLLIKSALESAIHTEFKPAYLENGNPLKVWITFPVRFSIE